MTAKEFHLFSLLPGELRDQIWDHSVRPYGFRGVQYFSVFEDDNIPKNFRSHLIPKTRKHQWHFISAPMPEKAESLPSWNSNRSTYAIDGGLWTACKESRAAMHRRYKPERWSEFYSRQRSLPIHEGYDSATGCEYYDMPATFLVNSDSGHQYFTLFPAQDLIFIRGYPSLPDIYSFYPSYIPFASSQYGFGGMRHVAIEFDPSWTLEELCKYEETFGRRLGNLSPDRWDAYDALVSVIRDERSVLRNTSIWLVDYRLRRPETEIPVASQNSADEAPERIIFEENGCKYYDVSEYRYYRYDEETYDQPGFLSVMDFAFEVQEAATRMEARQEEIDEWEVMGLNRFKFLVCEKSE